MERVIENDPALIEQRVMSKRGTARFLAQQTCEGTPHDAARRSVHGTNT
jgi:hypothetical protein